MSAPVKNTLSAPANSADDGFANTLLEHIRMPYQLPITVAQALPAWAHWTSTTAQHTSSP